MLARRGDRYGVLVVVRVFRYVVSGLAAGRFAGAFESVLFVVTLLLALRTSRVGRRRVRIVMGITVAGSAPSLALVLGNATDIGLGIVHIWSARVLLLTVGVILRRVLMMPTVSLQSIYGAVSAYMIIGLMFASIYAAMSRLQSGPFFASGSPANARTFQYFSFTTLTTLGYGDFTAGTNRRRPQALTGALVGPIFPGPRLAPPPSSPPSCPPAPHG